MAKKQINEHEYQLPINGTIIRADCKGRRVLVGDQVMTVDEARRTDLALRDAINRVEHTIRLGGVGQDSAEELTGKAVVRKTGRRQKPADSRQMGIDEFVEGDYLEFRTD